MSDPLIGEDDASTPLEQEELEQLIPSYITTRDELNSAEQSNIADAESWAFKRKRDALKTTFLTDLHKRMFNQVWKWAGTFRTTDRNIGVAPEQIYQRLLALSDNTAYWIDEEIYHFDEIAARFHHELVSIHPFPNGNGRHGRLATDLLLHAHGHERFTWGRGNLIDAGETRKAYVDALRAADQQDFDSLFRFVRS